MADASCSHGLRVLYGLEGQYVDALTAFTLPCGTIHIVPNDHARARLVGTDPVIGKVKHVLVEDALGCKRKLGPTESATIERNADGSYSLADAVPVASAATEEEKERRVTPRLHFCTFGSVPAYASTLARIEREAIDSGYFASVHVFTQDTLPGLAAHADFVARNRRGYGYWIWKPLVILETMRRAAPGDIVVYADAGCSVYANPDARRNMAEWVASCVSSPVGRVARANGCKESRYNKGDTIDLLGVARDSPHLGSSQIEAGVQLVRNTPLNETFIRDWFDLMTRDSYHYVTDAPSRACNPDGFKEHRHDQAIYSLMLKTRGGVILPPPRKADQLLQPIAATRIK